MEESEERKRITLYYERRLVNLINASELERKEFDLVSEEIKKRQEINDSKNDEANFSHEDLIGDYFVLGLNQNEEGTGYIGGLNITLTKDNRIRAKWLIDNVQIQEGTGFFKDNILVINFNYKGEKSNLGKTFKGVVVYQFISGKILKGFWSEKHAEDKCLGFEECRKYEKNEKRDFSLN